MLEGPFFHIKEAILPSPRHPFCLSLSGAEAEAVVRGFPFLIPRGRCSPPFGVFVFWIFPSLSRDLPHTSSPLPLLAEHMCISPTLPLFVASLGFLFFPLLVPSPSFSVGMIVFFRMSTRLVHRGLLPPLPPCVTPGALCRGCGGWPWLISCRIVEIRISEQIEI